MLNEKRMNFRRRWYEKAMKKHEPAHGAGIALQWCDVNPHIAVVTGTPKPVHVMAFKSDFTVPQMILRRTLLSVGWESDPVSLKDSQTVGELQTAVSSCPTGQTPTSGGRATRNRC